MKVAIHQPEHLPWLGFVDKLMQSDVFVLLDVVQFAKDDFQNRNRIKTEQGVRWVTVPVYKAGRSSQRVMDVEICNDRNWRNRAWSYIRTAYADAPFFSAYAPFFEELYGRQWQRLCDLNIEIIRYIADTFGVTTTILRASDLTTTSSGKTELNLDICRELGATEYLSGVHGRTYLDISAFRSNSIEVRFQEFRHPVYDQLWGSFVANLSSIDLLFNVGPASATVLDSSRSVSE